MHRFNEPIDDEFEKALIFFRNGKFILDLSFKQALFDFLTKHKNDSYEIHDHLFENFTSFWLNPDYTLKPIQLCDLVFDKILSLVHEWEDKNKPDKIHKGTPYYFYGTVSILKGDIEKGLLLMHQAYQEDKRLGRVGTDKPTPAECFILLEHGVKEQFFRQKVVETVNFLNERLECYRTINQTSLDIDLLRTKFLKKSSYYKEALFFVYSIYKLKKIINEIEPRIRENTIASYMETTLIFELCKLVEVLLKNIYLEDSVKARYGLRRTPTLFYYTLFFCEDINLSLKKENLDFLNGERDRNFKNTITKLTNHTYSDTGFVTNPIAIEFDVALTYCLRNFGGHKIEERETIYKEFPKIVQSILNMLFFIIEKKY